MNESNLVYEYREAREAVRATLPDSTIHKYAEDVLRELGGRAVIFKVNCMICNNEFDFGPIPVKIAVDLHNPRGLCGKCASLPTGGTAVVVES